jgi:uncharacterized membrane protein
VTTRPPIRDRAVDDVPVGELKNVQAIADLERSSRARRSRIECLSDSITGAAGSLPFVVAHLGWFGVWIAINSTSRAFDPFPFNLLTMIVSLEAILLSALLLMSQNRQMRDADRRSHLDLQVNLLAEQELTAILRVVARLAERNQINVGEELPELTALLRNTDVNKLADLVETRIESESLPTKT